jgi:predicted ester cyclase
MKTLSQILCVILCGILITLTSCQDQQAMEELARFQDAEKLKAENTELARIFYKHLDALQIDSLEALCAPDVKIYYQSGEPALFSEMVPFIKMFYEAFPDYVHKIEGVIAADDKVVVRVSFEGTFTNTFMEMSPSGEKFRYKGIQIFQFTNGKLKNMWVVEDELALMTQLGLELRPV